MTKHLKPEEIVDALDGALDLGRRAHLDSCATCAREVAALGGVTRDAVASADTNEPSPLFWTHFTGRVREATERQQTPTRQWLPIWQPLTAVAAIVVLAVIVVGMPRGGAPGTAPADAVVTDPAATVAEATTPVDDDTWTFVLDVARELPADTVREVAMPSPGTADALIETLSAEQRSEFIRLLRAEMGTFE